jgi:hypothetical protein
MEPSGIGPAFREVGLAAEVVPVSETFQGPPVWQGVVPVFEVAGQPTATHCSAWSSPIEGNDKRRFLAVLHIPPITSAQDAARAAIVQEFRARNSFS